MVRYSLVPGGRFAKLARFVAGSCNVAITERKSRNKNEDHPALQRPSFATHYFKQEQTKSAIIFFCIIFIYFQSTFFGDGEPMTSTVTATIVFFFILGFKFKSLHTARKRQTLYLQRAFNLPSVPRHGLQWHKLALKMLFLQSCLVNLCMPHLSWI